MPGVRMDNSVADGPLSENRKRTHDGSMVNGGHNAPRKSEGSLKSPDRAGVNGSTPRSAPADQLAQLPPEIAHLGSEFYHPLSKLLMRTVHESYNDLRDVLHSMVELPLNQQSNGSLVNGAGPYGVTNGGVDNSETNKQKKLLLMRFAQENRAKFIKLLVLTEWGGRSSADISKLIDLFTWTKEQGSHMEKVDFQVEMIKVLSNMARQFNPDIRTALQVLSKGKSDWIPNMGFIPPEPISSEEALRLLRSMNTSLSIRLHVHEQLPRHLKKWRVSSGRATFIIDDEFEFDVVSFVEDTSDQWHFIDLRLLFSPAPSVKMESQFMFSLKMQLDYILQQSGLNGCFDHLNNFVLTHKINVLRQQAYGLLRGGWAGSLRVEPVHRALVVQYWTDRPGKKNWVEVGISSHKPKHGKSSWRGPPLPSLTIRWFRQGTDVKDVKIEFDWKMISMERLLKQVLALHINHDLEMIRQQFKPNIAVMSFTSETEPSDCALVGCLGNPANKVVLSVEPVTGKFTMQPATTLTSWAEQKINQAKDLSNISGILTNVLAQNLLDMVHQPTQQLGWEVAPSQSLRVELKSILNLDVLQCSLYWPRGWPARWAIAVAIVSSGESWWVCKMGGQGSRIEYAENIPLQEHDGMLAKVNRAALSRIDRVAVSLVAFRVTSRALAAEDKPHKLEWDFGSSKTPFASSEVVRGWVMLLRTEDLLSTKPGEESWLQPQLRVTCEGIGADYHSVHYIASGSMTKSVAADMQKLMSASPQNNFCFFEDGYFSIFLSVPFGEDILSELRARLRDLDRLRSFATTLQERKIQLRSSSLQHVEFQYSGSQTVTVNFGKETDLTISFPAHNPHNRMKGLLANVMKDDYPSLPPLVPKHSTNFDKFCALLMLTRPLVTGLADIVSSSGTSSNPSLHIRSLGECRVRYANPPCSFEVKLKRRDDKVFWLIEDSGRNTQDRKANHKRSERLQSSLTSLFQERVSNTQGWFGVKIGLAANVDSVGNALNALHNKVMQCAIEPGFEWEVPGAAPMSKQGFEMLNLGSGSGPGSGQGTGQVQKSKKQQSSQIQGSGSRAGHTGGVGVGKSAKKQEIIELD